MNQADRKEFETIHGKIDQLQSDIKFIKENMFNPHEGLWAETKLNSQFRANTMKWRGVVGTGFVGLIFKHIWDMFNGWGEEILFEHLTTYLYVKATQVNEKISFILISINNQLIRLRTNIYTNFDNNETSILRNPIGFRRL